ncbi:YhcN/YlaJ family sporulation lipoprotein [Paenibacillus sp. GSMTC-2017]|uniref:YhcN/YlaJ family sporulation lipoprotein n=1 Tax=Paenibacillus sp. GSMTC-2017 TaxID=2794350 RepID=UPI0018D8B524|nr:YhcN/YlaJ family sporulation lipoprotein [Paenibacillus sp. GSMTC-2017]MBH5316923.1 YhcN/YlaJ family sporulation lipoprotein [Paenibacillus sp. GSMTC-2017]
MSKWLTATLVIMILVSGCGNGTKNETSPSSHNNHNLQAKQNESGKKLIQDRAQVEVHLEELAKGIEGVKNAHCVIVGNTAVVGIDVDGSLDRSRVGIIKYSVAEAFRNDPYGIDALVTADIDIASRLNEIGTDIKNGRPISGFAEELADIMGRLIPQIPRDVMPSQVNGHNRVKGKHSNTNHPAPVNQLR